nr:phosphoglycerol transferase [Afipia sp.]
MSVITTSTPASSKVQLWLKWLGDTGWLWRIRVALIAAMHLTAIYVLASVEYGPFAMTLALLTWGLLNFLWLIAFRRPGVSAALSLALVAALIVLSQFKYGIMQLTLTFLDFLIIDRDTVSFLHSIFPQLKTQSIVLVAIAVPVMWLVWRADPFRVRRA